jgi:hypothetical protein
MRITIEINGKTYVVDLSDESRDALQQIARRNGIRFEDALQQAILNENFLESVTDQGAQLLIKEDDKPLRELNFA